MQYCNILIELLVLLEVVSMSQHADEKRQEVPQTNNEYGQSDNWSNNQEPVGVEEGWNSNQRVRISTRMSSKIQKCSIKYI